MKITTRGRRGLSLPTVTIVVAVLVILVAAALTFTGHEMGSAAQHKRREVMTACTTAARNFFLSQFQTGGPGRANNAQLRGSTTVGDLIISAGHLDEPDGGAAAVEPIDLPQGVSELADATNTTRDVAGSGRRQAYRVVAHCTDRVSGDAMETEFQVVLSF